MEAIERLAADLGRLRRAAGDPSLRQIIGAVRRRAPGTALGVATLQNWFKGLTVPSDPRTFAVVVEVLEGTAARNGRPQPGSPVAPESGYRPRDTAYWEGLRKACVEQRRAARSAEPRPERPAEPRPERSAELRDAGARSGRSRPVAGANADGTSRPRIWLVPASPLTVNPPTLVWTPGPNPRREPGARTVRVEIPPVAVDVPDHLDPRTFLPDGTDAIHANCRDKRGRTEAVRSVPVRSGGVELGTFSLNVNLGGCCGLAWAEFKTGLAARPFVSSGIDGIVMSFRRVRPRPPTSAADEIWSPSPANARYSDVWTDALRVERGSVFTAELAVVVTG
ncbi:hypothetical protein [Actinomadura gamaensis]|uniref:Uncharacterized protein n=1 Tax=Actinomadura gamaensis TaxID=1763541 RepID=A0ABV9UCK7_9ACTN